MSIFLLDTNIPIKAIKGRESVLAQNIGAALEAGHELAISVVSLHELEVGVLRNTNAQTAAKKRDVFLGLVKHVWDIDTEDALLAARIRCELMAIGQSIGVFDVFIAAQAKRRGVTLITNNTREFTRVPELIVLDWTLPA